MERAECLEISPRGSKREIGTEKFDKIKLTLYKLGFFWHEAIYSQYTPVHSSGKAKGEVFLK